MRVDVATFLAPGETDATMAFPGVVDVALLHGYRSERLGVHVTPDDISDVVRRTTAPTIGFAGVDPLAPDLDDILNRIKALGMQGVTISPADQGCRPTHDRCMALLGWCADRGMPVMVTNPSVLAPGSVLDFLHPILFDEVLRELPTLRLVLGDLGTAYLEESLLLVAKHEHAYAEISTLANRTVHLHHGLLSAHERGVMRKLLFGSGWPARSPEAVTERIFGFNAFDGPSRWASIPGDDLRGLIERDALALLGLKAPEGSGTDALAPSRQTP